MGGNVTIEGRNAQPWCVTAQARKDFVKDFTEFMLLLSARFNSKYDEYLWLSDDPSMFVSGSTAHIFDENIDDSALECYKSCFGDIDVQVDLTKRNKLIKLFDEDVSVIGEFEYIGYKLSVNTIVTLWEYRGQGLQIDFELVEFDLNFPTLWSTFAFSSSWTDVLWGIKGFAHKYIFRALTGRWLADYEIVNSKKNPVRTSTFAFSNKGLRRKLVPNDDGTWVELKTSDSVFITTPSLVFNHLIGRHPEEYELKEEMWSYVGMCNIIRKSIDPSEWEIIEDSMANLLFGPGAQQLSKDAGVDLQIKMKALMHLTGVLNMTYTKWDSMVNSYYDGILQDN